MFPYNFSLIRFWFSTDSLFIEKVYIFVIGKLWTSSIFWGFFFSLSKLYSIFADNPLLY